MRNQFNAAIGSDRLALGPSHGWANGTPDGGIGHSNDAFADRQVGALSDALETRVQGRVCLLGDAAHLMLPTFGQGAAQSFEDAAALTSAFALHKRDVNAPPRADLFQSLRWAVNW